MHVTHSSQPLSNSNFKHASLLVVEDNDDHWRLIQLAMERSLPEVKTYRSSTANEAINFLHTCHAKGQDLPKLILLDLYLPNREDGWGLLQQIKHSSSLYKKVPVVIVSYSTNRDDIIDSYYLGSTSFITKPVGLQEWEEYIKTLRLYWWETVTLPNDRFVS